MALNPAQQAQELLTRATSILVVASASPSTDQLAAAVACGQFLQATDTKKAVDVVVPGFDAKDAPAFLKTESVRAEVGPLKALHVSLDVTKTPLSELMYDVKDGTLEITVVPKDKAWKPNEVKVRHGDYRYDLVVALGAADMASLGALARDNADFLHDTPVINIDCASANEYWGQVNLVDLNAVSVTELLFRFFEHWDRNKIDAALATALLAGMIANTKSFRTPNVTPKTLSMASALVARGAAREKIVTSLWRTRSVPTLKLWGRALTYLEHDEERALVWSVLTAQDFLECGAATESLDDVIDELLSYAPEAKTVALIYEPADRRGICVTVACQPPRSATELGRGIGATGTRTVATACLLDKNLVDARDFVVTRLQQRISATF